MEILILDDQSLSHDPAEAAFSELRRIIQRLREKDGCPWDREQTHTSLRSALIEECWESVAAIEAEDDQNLSEELGDVLLVLLMHARIAEEREAFSFEEIARNTSQKLIRRHPHVFGDSKVKDSKDVLLQWDEIKRREKGNSESILDGVSMSFPALLRAQEIQKKATKVGFDWAEWTDVLEKLAEEIKEVQGAIAEEDPKHVEEELGDILFTVVNLCRKLRCNAEVALQRTTNKFSERFKKLESIISQRELSIKDLSLSELDTIWNEVKREEHGEA